MTAQCRISSIIVRMRAPNSTRYAFVCRTISVLLLVLFASMTAAPLSAESRPVRESAPGVFYYFGDEMQVKSANCVWIVFKDYVLAIDANYPWGAEEILEDIRETTSKPVRFLFNTHYHHDHSFGNSVFVDAGATIVSTADTADEMRGPLGEKEWGGIKLAGHSMKGYRREFPSLTFKDRLVFDDGVHRVELIRMGPAHTRGDGVAYLPKEKILVTGDLFVNGNPWGNNVGDRDVDYDGWLQALDTMAGWDVTWWCQDMVKSEHPRRFKSNDPF